MKVAFRIAVITFFTLTILATSMFSLNNVAKSQLPGTSGIVTIAFDDGWNSQFSNAFPLMQQHGFVGTYYIITGNVGTGFYMNMSDLQALRNAGNEIASHSVDHPNFTGLNDSQIIYECNASQQFLKANGFPAANFAYPSGYANNHTDNIVLQYYKSARHTYGSGYLMFTPPNATQIITPMGVDGETGDSSALKKDEAIIAQAHATNSWVIICFHSIMTTLPTSQYQIEKSDFNALLNYVGNSSVQVLTVNQALHLWSPPDYVNMSPASAAIDVGQSQNFTTLPSSSTIQYRYHWYLDDKAVSSNDSYTFNATSAGLHNLYVNVTNPSGTSSAVKSNNVTIVVNPVLTAPTITATPSTVNVGQNCSLFSSSITTGTSPYSYQWFDKPPNGNYLTLSSESQSTSFDMSNATTSGYWSFILQVEDNAGAALNSSAVSVLVNPTILSSVNGDGFLGPNGNVNVNYGENQTFSITPDTNHNIADVSVDGSSVGTVTSYTFTNIQASHNITATFVLASTPTPVPTDKPESTPTSSPNPTLTANPTSQTSPWPPTENPKPTIAPTLTHAPLASQKQTKLGLPQESVYVIASTLTILSICGTGLVLTKSKKCKS